MMNKRTRLTPFHFLIWSLCIGLPLLGACNSNNKKAIAGPQPTLDSVYITEQMNAEPAFKDQLLWAKNFYRERNFQLGWFKNHELVPQAAKMLDIIAKAGEEGLDPKDYQIKDFDTLFEEFKKNRKDSVKRNELEKQIDVALSGTYFNWASDYYRGLVVPKENKEIEWDVKRNKIKLHKALLTVLGERESKYPYADFAPLHPEYTRLKKAFAKYRAIKAKGGWKTVQDVTLKPGQNSPAVAALRSRFSVLADTAGNNTSTVYDQNLVASVKAFQQQVGLNPTGIVDADTRRELNVPVDARLRQIVINMERWRWIPKSFEADYLMVNIPEYRLHVFEKGQERMNMNVIVGKTLNQTPIFSDRMEYVVLAPYWNVPINILKNEYASKFAANPGLVETLNMEVVTSKGDPVDPGSIDWMSVDEGNWKYILRKKPGPKNDLGDVKFIFPNTNDIYLHDTPHDQLFSQAKRGFSHGCVRVEKPIQLATYLLRNVPGWDQSKIQSTIAVGEEKFVPLKQKLPVYLVYFTAWADDAGNVSFRDDIYGHDKVLASQYFSKL